MCEYIYNSLNNLHLQNISILPNSKVHTLTKRTSARNQQDKRNVLELLILKL